LRRKSLLQKLFSNGFNILAVDAYSGVELCTPIWLNHDYGDGGVVDILAVNAYSGVDVCTTIFIGEARTHPLTKLNTNKSCYANNIWPLVGMCMSLRNLSKFIQFRSISKLGFSGIDTNSYITPRNNLDMVTVEFLLA
jgi:hypothetical protein